jgi:uncharacterized membrane protein YqjE
MANGDRPIAAVLSDIVGDVQQIIRAEVRLARVEIREELGKAKRGALLVAAASALMLLAVAALLLSAIYALATVWPPWAAALAVALALAAIGGALAMTGASRIRSVHLPPQKTVSTVRENIQWAKTRAR